jgi:5-methylcytosine-specific restriction endonuclease McrA
MKVSHGFGDWNIQLGFEQRFRCIYCDSDLLATYDAYNSWQWDHIFPTSKGGEHTVENIAICCKACNYLKRAYIPSGATREEQIVDARRYVLEMRKRLESELSALRDLVRGTG